MIARKHYKVLIKRNAFPPVNKIFSQQLSNDSEKDNI